MEWNSNDWYGTIDELDEHPDKRWPVHDDDGSFHYAYYTADEFTVTRQVSCRPGESQNEFVAACACTYDTNLLCRLLNTRAKNEFYKRKGDAR